MSKIEVNTITQQCGPSLTVGGGACKSVTLDATTVTLGRCGATVSLAAGATQTGFGRTGTVDWCTTAKTAPFTGVSGKGYFVNTTCGAVTVTLPATPTAGDIISIKDYARTAATNNITFCRNGSKMDGTCASGSITTDGDSTTLIYVDGTKGWTSILDSTTNTYGAQFVGATGGTITICGDYKTHIFTSDGCFAVSCAGNPVGSDTVDYFVVAGGGGGSDYFYAGGGGAGGFRISNSYSIPAPTTSPLASPTGLPVSVQTYPITVGGGGATPNAGCAGGSGSPGSNSVFLTITAAGGGGGSNCSTAGLAGGSGGGGSGGGPIPAPDSKQGGAGNTPPVAPPQGNNGGNGNPGPQPVNGGEGGGGGGAGAVGANAGPCQAGDGGAGSFFANAVIGPTAPSYGAPGPVGSTRYFSGGGGGGTDSVGTNRGTGGDGGGGQGAPISAAGTANTGGGGGGGSHTGNPPAAGGRWKWYSNDKV
jgi:hypothetical protein